MRRRALSGMLMVFLLVLCIWSIASAEEVSIGALLALTGDVSSMGLESKAALEIAANDVNNYLSSIGSNKRIKLLIEDTKADPDIALKALKGFAGQGIKIVIGPMTSGEVKAVKAFADKNGIMLISHSSTATTLAIPNDNLFRLVPDDNNQAEVIAKLIVKNDVKVIVPMWRDDLWGNNLVSASKKWFEKLDGTVMKGVKYDPEHDDFTAQLKSLETQVNEAVGKYGKEKVGVYLISLNEAALILDKARNYSVLSDVRWYGSDGTALDNLLLSNPSAAAFAHRTRFTSPLYCGATTEQRFLLKDKIQKKLGRAPDAYAAVAYDALWIASMTVAITDRMNDAKALRTALKNTANKYYGVTGWTVLNDADDRDFGDYNFWAITKKGNSYKWENIAKFIYDPALEGIVIYLK